MFLERASPLQVFSTGSFPSGHVKKLQNEDADPSSVPFTCQQMENYLTWLQMQPIVTAAGGGRTCQRI